MIKKFKTIDNFAVFHHFDWDSNVRDKGNNIAEFKKLNILYGRNYSGKTTLSRIFRAFEKGCRHEKYLSARFELDHSGTKNLTHETVDACPYIIRVYNSDFVGENLRWLIDEEGDIKTFAILGEKNVEIEKEIEKKEKILGNVEQKTGLRHEFKIKEGEYRDTQEDRIIAESDLDKQLRRKANDDIKRNTLYNEVTYNIKSIKADISSLKSNPRPFLNDNKIEEKRKLLKEEAKYEIQRLPDFVPSFHNIHDITEKLLSKEIKPTESIQDLLNDALLQEWVRTGIGYHKGKRLNCAFCGGKLPDNLWEKLDAHFSKESEELRNNIKDHIILIEQEKNKINEIVKLEKQQFYAFLYEQFDEKIKEWNNEVKQYCSNMDTMIDELKEREKDIFKTRKLGDMVDNSENIRNILTGLNELIMENNRKSKTLTNDQSLAKEALRLDEVAKFMRDINYDEVQSRIKGLLGDEEKLRGCCQRKREIIEKIKSDINELKIQLKDERRGADEVNEYLNHYFGHKGIRLVAIEQEENSGFNFQIMRDEEVARNLSEGERSLIAFCYFMAKLDDIETRNEGLIIWIDDPVSSLDYNHIFFVYSLIENIIAKPVKQADGSNAYIYRQLFISTHNLDFLKYLKRLSCPKNDTEYFLLESGNKESRLLLMPDYLKNYITEFIYLFHQIYKCTDEKNANVEHASFYNFGNNLRKFLEAYLFYKYPTNISMGEKLASLFGDDQISVNLTNRIENEMSHLEEIFDRSMRPIEIPEIPKVAKYVLNKIKEKDREQYKALMKSIGENDEK